LSSVISASYGGADGGGLPVSDLLIRKLGMYNWFNRRHPMAGEPWHRLLISSSMSAPLPQLLGLLFVLLYLHAELACRYSQFSFVLLGCSSVLDILVSARAKIVPHISDLAALKCFQVKLSSESLPFFDKSRSNIFICIAGSPELSLKASRTITSQREPD